MNNNTKQLEDLVGEHYLSGVDRDKLHQDRNQYLYDDAEVLNFILDDITYSCVEDPNDGYRSSLGELFVSNARVLNRFPPIKVIGVMNYRAYGERSEILEFHDAINDKIVLEIGTGNMEDYYPYWVGNFFPQNMSINDPSI